MTAGQATSSNNHGLAMALLAAIVVCALLTCAAAVSVPGSPQVITVPGAGEVVLGDHATQRHGNEAEIVREAMQTGRPPSRWQCKEGKEYLSKRLDEPLPSGDWGLMVLCNGHEITAFATTREYILRVLDEDVCSNGWGYAHP